MFDYHLHSKVSFDSSCAPADIVMAAEKAGLKEDAQDVNVRIRRLNGLYKDFSKAADLPEQRERMKVIK